MSTWCSDVRKVDLGHLVEFCRRYLPSHFNGATRKTLGSHFSFLDAVSEIFLEALPSSISRKWLKTGIEYSVWDWTACRDTNKRKFQTQRITFQSLLNHFEFLPVKRRAFTSYYYWEVNRSYKLIGNMGWKIVLKSTRDEIFWIKISDQKREASQCNIDRGAAHRSKLPFLCDFRRKF